jgi:tetratricopeptide (TPR) repeat protein
MRYFRSFFVPLFLSGDTDLKPFDSLWRPGALAGFAFLASIAAAAVLAARHRPWRPVSFGLWWFLLGLVPTSVYPLGELENDHRMFLPFIGLSLAVVWTAALLAPLEGAGRLRRGVVAAALFTVLAALAWGAHRRNEIWRNDESFWRDVAAKSPNNPRGLLNYGFALTKAGNPAAAWPVLERAQALAPNQSMAPVGFALAAEALHLGDDRVRSYYQRAISLAPAESVSYTYYGKWQRTRGRRLEAQEAFARAAYLNPMDFDSRYALLEIYSESKDWVRLAQTANELIGILPPGATARRYLALASGRLQRLDDAERAASGHPTAENYAALAAEYEDDGQYGGAIQAARKALELRPGFAEAARILAESESATPRK